MVMASRKEQGALEALRAIAARYPDVEEGIACKGTAVESVTCKVRKRAFLFLRPAAVMLKLRESLGEASGLARKEPGRYSAGSGGWVTVREPDAAPLPMDMMKRWIGESYGLMSESAPASKTAPRKKTARKG
jgi:hypothetical protein